jgi:hypothetical protein
MGTDEKKYQDLAPGLTETIQAGDELVMTDKEGNEFSVAAKESDDVMDFLKAFDRWFSMHNRGITGVVLQAAWFDVEQSFRSLPVRVAHELPSWADIVRLGNRAGEG